MVRCEPNFKNLRDFYFAHLLALVLAEVLFGISGTSAQRLSFRSVNGYGNNPVNPLWGVSGATPAQSYEYNNDFTSFPSVSEVSEKIAASQKLTEKSSNKLSVLYVSIGQLLLIDVFDLAEDKNTSRVPWNIPIAKCDRDFDITCNGDKNFTLPKLLIKKFLNNTPQFRNDASSFVDASFLYGSHENVTRTLRTFYQGKLKMSALNMFPEVHVNSYTAGGQLFEQKILFQSGNVKINQNAGTQAIAILLAREHNRHAEEIRKNQTTISEDLIFELARQWVVSVWQLLIFEFWVPITIGRKLPSYPGYNPRTNPNVDLYFGTTAMRFLDSMLPDELGLDSTHTKLNRPRMLRLKETFYNTDFVRTFGIACVIEGLSINSARDVDPYFSRGTRMLFNNTSFDFAAEILLRGREVGVPSYDKMRVTLGYASYSLFPSFLRVPIEAPFTVPDFYASATAGFSGVTAFGYSAVDAYIGGISEPPVGIGTVGESFYKSIYDQFVRLSNGDRYFFRSLDNYPFASEREQVYSYTFKKMVILNTELDDFIDEIMIVSEEKNPTKVYIPDPRILHRCEPLEYSNLVRLTDGFMLYYEISGEMIRFEIRVNYTTGYFGFGFGIGGGMKNTDIYLIQIYDQNNVTVQDMWSFMYAPTKDSALGGSDDISEIKIKPASEYWKMAVSFKRPLKTGDKYDYEIKLNEPATLVYAYSKSSKLSYHGPAYCGSLKMIFVNTDEKNYNAAKNKVAVEQVVDNKFNRSWDCNFINLHLLAECFLAFFLFPLSIFLTRFRQHDINGLYYHALLSNIVTTFAILDCGLAVMGNLNKNMTGHGIFALAIVFFYLFCTYSGYRIGKGCVKLVKQWRRVHVICGYICYASLFVNCFYGVRYYAIYAKNTIAVNMAMLLWSILILSFYIRENVKQKTIKSVNRILPFPHVGDSKQQERLLRNLLCQRSMQTFTWSEVQNRIHNGSKLAVLYGLIVDLRLIALVHPGIESEIYAQAGSDISFLFDGHLQHPNIEKINAESQHYSPHKAGQNFVHRQLRESHENKKKTTSFYEAYGLGIDKKMAHGGLHAHSSYALRIAHDHALGVVNCDTIILVDPKRSVPPYIPAVDPQQRLLFFNYPQRGIVISKNKISCTKSLREIFQLDILLENTLGVMWNIPGDTVEIRIWREKKMARFWLYLYRCRSKGKITIIEKKSQKANSLDWVSQMEVGDSAQFLGPINISPFFSKKKSLSLYENIAIITKGSSKVLGMQVIDFFLRYKKKSTEKNVKKSIIMIAGFKSESDIFLKEEDDKMMTEGGEKISIYYALPSLGGESGNPSTYGITENAIIKLIPQSGTWHFSPKAELVSTALLAQAAINPRTEASVARELDKVVETVPPTERGPQRECKDLLGAESDASSSDHAQQREKSDGSPHLAAFIAKQPRGTSVSFREDPALQGEETTSPEHDPHRESGSEAEEDSTNDAADDGDCTPADKQKTAKRSGSARGAAGAALRGPPKHRKSIVLVCGDRRFNEAVSKILAAAGKYEPDEIVEMAQNGHSDDN